nr:ribonuclease H-like domain-containing protein [Tanacetum cinerariifolium]
MKGIKREFSVPRTPQQNGIAKRKNKTLIEAARTMMADSLLPISFWAKAVNTACYVQNRVLVTKPYTKTPYELLHGRTSWTDTVSPLFFKVSEMCNSGPSSDSCSLHGPSLVISKFNFSKYIFNSLVRNVDSSSKFYMYPRVRKGFSGVETPLFEGMLVVQENVVEGIADEQVPDDTVIVVVQETALDACAALTLRVEHLKCDKESQTLDITKLKTRVKKLEKVNKVKVLKLRRLKKVRTSQRVETSDDTIIEDAEIYQINLDHPSKVLSMQDDDSEVQEVVEVVTTAKLITEVVNAASTLVSTASTIIPTAEPNIPAVTVTAAPVKVAAASTRRRRGVVKLDEAYARKLHKELNHDIDWDVAMDHVKQKAKEDLTLLDSDWTTFEAKFNSNMEFLLKSKEKIEEEANRALESINETPDQKVAKQRRLNEQAKEIEDLKQHLEIVLDEDDDVYTEVTPLDKKVPVVDYQIIQVNNKPRYKIIKADGTHQQYVSFITLLKNFDREDLESLWSIVNERFSTSKTNNFSDEYLLTTLKTMFGRLDG